MTEFSISFGIDVGILVPNSSETISDKGLGDMSCKEYVQLLCCK